MNKKYNKLLKKAKNKNDLEKVKKILIKIQLMQILEIYLGEMEEIIKRIIIIRKKIIIIIIIIKTIITIKINIHLINQNQKKAINSINLKIKKL